MPTSASVPTEEVQMSVVDSCDPVPLSLPVIHEEQIFMSEDPVCPENTSFLPLLRFKTLTSITSSFQIHLVPHEDQRTRASYVAVVLFRRDFIDGGMFVACCSICKKTSHLLRMCTQQYCSVLHCSNFEVIECQHIENALQNACQNANISFNNNAHKQLAELCKDNPPRVTGFWNGELLHGVKHALYVHISEDFLIGVLQRRRYSWYCHLCKAYSCSHKKSVSEYPEVAVEEDSHNDPCVDMLRKILKSEKRYKFDDCVYWCSLINRNSNFGAYLDSKFLKNDSGNYVIIPEEKTCKDCGNIMILGPGASRCLLVATVLYFNVEIYTSWCQNNACNNGKKVHFDGHSFGLVNYKNKVIMCATVCREYLITYSNSGISFLSWWRSKYSLLIDTLPLKEAAATNKWLDEQRSDIAQCVIGFAELIDYPSQYLGCCPNPSRITMDGIVLSVESKRIPEFTENWITQQVGFRASNRETRSLIIDVQDEFKVAVLLCTKKQVPFDTCKHFISAQHSGLAVVCHILVKKFHRQPFVSLSSSLKSFLSCFTKKTNPAIRMAPAFLHSNLQELQNFPEPISEDLYLSLLKYSPLVLNLLEAARDAGITGGITMKVKQFLTELISVASSTYENCDDLREGIADEEELEFYSEYSAPLSSYLWQTGNSFPLYPVLCKLPNVSLRDDRDFLACNKEYHQKGKCGAGVVPFWCMEHQKCLGFVVLDTAESPRAIMNTIITRFPNTELVMYDNACHLHEYGLNRFPNAIKNMQFCIDTLHWNNHTSCSEAYNCNLYRHQIGNTSSVLCEQRNSVLARLKKTAPHLNFRSFCALLQYAIVSLNRQQDLNLESSKH